MQCQDRRARRLLPNLSLTSDLFTRMGRVGNAWRLFGRGSELGMLNKIHHSRNRSAGLETCFMGFGSQQTYPRQS